MLQFKPLQLSIVISDGTGHEFCDPISPAENKIFCMAVVVTPKFFQGMVARRNFAEIQYLGVLVPIKKNDDNYKMLFYLNFANSLDKTKLF